MPTKRDLIEIAASDELVMRGLCAAYQIAEERGLNMNHPHTLGVLMSGVIRLAAALAYASDITAQDLSDEITKVMGQQPGITQVRDPAVRRWLYIFREDYVDSDTTAQLLPSIDPPTQH